MKKIILLVFCVTFLAQAIYAKNTVRIVSFSGDVKVRRGLDEEWNKVNMGDVLEDMDSILTGDDGIVKLRLSNGQIFNLDNNSLIDISDLREVTEKELFIYIMSNKIKTIKKSEEKTPLRIGSVSVVHGEKKGGVERVSPENYNSDKWIREKNAARAMFDQKYYTNTILKLHKIISEYHLMNDCGEIYFYLGKSFELINKSGQAIDAYQNVLKTQEEQGCNTSVAREWSVQAKNGIKRLSQ